MNCQVGPGYWPRINIERSLLLVCLFTEIKSHFVPLELDVVQACLSFLGADIIAVNHHAAVNI